VAFILVTFLWPLKEKSLAEWRKRKIKKKTYTTEKPRYFVYRMTKFKLKSKKVPVGTAHPTISAQAQPHTPANNSTTTSHTA
jgi:hypothetical protein